MKKAANSANAFLGPFQKIARAMSRNWNVQVVPSAYECCTDGNTIRYPFNADHLDGANRKALHGLLDHEVAHIAEEREHTEAAQRTPLKIMRDAKSSKEKMLLNVFEDIRIETKYSEKFQGVAENLHEANVNSVDLFKKRHGIDGEKGNTKRTNFWHTLGSAIIMKARGYSVEWLPKKYRPFLEAVKDEIQASTKTKWACESYELAQRVLSKINDKVAELEEQKQKREEQKQEQKQQKSEEQEQEGEQGAGDQSEDEGQEGEQAEGGQDEEQESSQDKGKKKGATKDDQEGTEQGADEDKGGDEEGSSKASNEGSEAPKSDEGEGEQSSELTDEELAEAAQAGDDAVSTDCDTDDLVKQVKDQVLDIAKTEAKDSQRYVPNPNVLKADLWIKPEDKSVGAQAEYDKCKAIVAAQIRGLRGKLLNVIRARASSHMEGGKRKGKLDKARLAQVPAGNTNVFQVEVEGQVLDTAISVVIDMSGSMGSGSDMAHKAYYAKLMAIALAETFETLNVSFEIIGFRNDWGRRIEVCPGTYRSEPLVYSVFKDFNDNFKRVRTRLNKITGDGNNTDGEAVMACALRLAQRSEARKIMFVLSDGMPAGGGVDRDTLCKHLGEVIKDITSSGVEVVGIGAMTDHINEFYNKEHGASGVVINDMTKLAIEVYKLMRARLLADEKRRVA